MKIAQPVRTGAWILIGLNLLIAFGSIGVLTRMAPAIDVILVRNEVSLQACQNMLAALAAPPTAEPAGRLETFRTALERAGNNITEHSEPGILRRIEQHYTAAFSGDTVARERTVAAILELGTANRDAMRTADRKAQQLGYAGAWGVVFMAAAAFLAGMMFLHSLKDNLADPLQEVDTTIDQFLHGDALRRAALNKPSRSIRRLLANLNQLLDESCALKNRDTSR